MWRSGEVATVNNVLVNLLMACVTVHVIVSIVCSSLHKELEEVVRATFDDVALSFKRSAP